VEYEAKGATARYKKPTHNHYRYVRTWLNRYLDGSKSESDKQKYQTRPRPPAVKQKPEEPKEDEPSTPESRAELERARRVVREEFGPPMSSKEDS
jgi:hypothetical protein